MSLTAQETQELQSAWHDPRRRFGDYVVLHELGRGGMGVVLKAYDPRTERLVAIKQMLQLGNERGRQRFEREARLTSQLQHPSIPRTFQVVASGPNAPYLVMEFVRGSPLDKVWGGHPHEGRRVAALLVSLAEAIACAHERGILHRDLKPQNVVVSAEGRPMVLDFGLGKQLDADEEGLTKTGAMLGSPSYMAPELVSNAKNAGPACDVYGLGAILYQGLTGRPPFEGDEVHEVVGAVLMAPPTPPSDVAADVDPALEAICLTCLAKDPAERYASAGELADDLQAYLSEEEEREEGLPLGLVIGVAAILLLGVGALVFGVLSAMGDEPVTAASSIPRAGKTAAPGAAPPGVEAPHKTEPAKTSAQEPSEVPGTESIEAAKDWAQRGRECLRRGEFKAAAELFGHAVRLDPSDADLFARRGFCHFKLKQYQEAVRDYGQAIRLQPEVSLFWANRASNLRSLGKFREALADARQAIKRGTKEPGVFLTAGECCAELGDLRAAERYYSQAIRLNPRRLFYYGRRALARKKLQDYRGAIGDYNRRLEQRPQGELYASRAWCYYRLGDYRRAARDYGAAIGLEPNNADYYRNRAANLGRTGQLGPALRDLKQAVQLEPANPRSLLVRAQVLFEAKQYRKSLADLDLFLKQRPNHAQALRARALIVERLKR